MREKPVSIEVRKDGKYWAVLAEEQLVALAVYEKGAQTLDGLLHGLLRYSSRKFFRLALSEALNPKPPKEGKTPKADKAKKPDKEKTAAPKAKGKKAESKKTPVKSERATKETAASAQTAPPVEPPSEAGPAVAPTN